MNGENKHNDNFLKEFDSKKNPFKTPENYFDSFSEKIALQKTLPKNTGFTVPENYLETFKVRPPKSKVRVLLPYISIAAMIAVGVFIFKPNNHTNLENQLDNGEIINYLANEESIDVYDILNTVNKEDLPIIYAKLDELESSLELNSDDNIKKF